VPSLASQPYSGYVAAPKTIVLSSHHMPVLHSRKADLRIISFERNVAGKINSDRGAATPHMEFWPRRPSATSAVQGYTLLLTYCNLIVCKLHTVLTVVMYCTVTACVMNTVSRR
jgi:hypothetical protein